MYIVTCTRLSKKRKPNSRQQNVSFKWSFPLSKAGMFSQIKNQYPARKNSSLKANLKKNIHSNLTFN